MKVLFCVSSYLIFMFVLCLGSLHAVEQGTPIDPSREQQKSIEFSGELMEDDLDADLLIIAGKTVYLKSEKMYGVKAWKTRFLSGAEGTPIKPETLNISDVLKVQGEPGAENSVTADTITLLQKVKAGKEESLDQQGKRKDKSKSKPFSTVQKKNGVWVN
ncbi:MAG: hypothetical protein CSA20_08780 [Deltaproteobacteria bacterium]|nr:MAG: hypothetical protein CSA20_08780 [Deltaproteobacteria bacterium]